MEEIDSRHGGDKISLNSYVVPKSEHWLKSQSEGTLESSRNLRVVKSATETPTGKIGSVHFYTSEKIEKQS